MLLGRDAGERLEPVGVVRGAVLDRPVLQRARHDVREGRVERLGLRDGAPERTVDILRQTGALRFIVEGQRAEVLAGLWSSGRGLVWDWCSTD